MQTSGTASTVKSKVKVSAVHRPQFCSDVEGTADGAELARLHLHCSPPSENELSTGISQMDALLEAKVFAAQRGCPPESLPQACAAHRIFAVVIDEIPLYPAFYVDPRFDQRKLEAITKLLGDLAGGSKWQFFTSAKGSLGSVTPLQALLAGRYGDVRVAAPGFAER